MFEDCLHRGRCLVSGRTIDQHSCPPRAQIVNALLVTQSDQRQSPSITGRQVLAFERQERRRSTKPTALVNQHGVTSSLLIEFNVDDCGRSSSTSRGPMRQLTDMVVLSVLVELENRWLTTGISRPVSRCNYAQKKTYLTLCAHPGIIQSILFKITFNELWENSSNWLIK